VKTLAKHPSGSEIIASPANLSFLLSLSASQAPDLELSYEALRCVANALLLVEKARTTWVEQVVGGGSACIELLNVSDLSFLEGQFNCV